MNLGKFLNTSVFKKVSLSVKWKNNTCMLRVVERMGVYNTSKVLGNIAIIILYLGVLFLCHF